MPRVESRRGVRHTSSSLFEEFLVTSLSLAVDQSEGSVRLWGLWKRGKATKRDSLQIQ